MNNESSLLKKQLFLYISIILATLTLFGVSTSRFFGEHYINNTKNALITQGEKISQQYAQSIYTGIINIDKLKYEMQVLEDYMNASVFLMDSKGQIGVVSSKINEKWVGQTLTDEAIQLVLEGNIVDVKGRISGMFNESVLTVGYPIIVNGDVKGGIFMCKSLPDLNNTIRQIEQMGFYCLLVSIFLGVVMVFESTKRMTKPIVQMNQAAKVISSGNFQNRIEIERSDEIGQLAESFNQMAESLEIQDKKRKDFIANISHDLRSPLTSMQGFLGAIIDGTIPEEKKEHYLQIVLEETKRLSKIANDIVTLSEAQSDMLVVNMIDFDVNELIRDYIEKIEPRLQEKNIIANMEFEEKSLYACADPDKIGRVIQNLLDNAIKFSDENGNIVIETAVENKDYLKVIIRDSGKGIAKEDLKYIFDRFYKTDSSRGIDKKSGGLGLSIAKEFVKANGGTIRANSEEGKGAEFIFTLKRSVDN